MKLKSRKKQENTNNFGFYKELFNSVNSTLSVFLVDNYLLDSCLIKNDLEVLQHKRKKTMHVKDDNYFELFFNNKKIDFEEKEGIFLKEMILKKSKQLNDPKTRKILEKIFDNKIFEQRFCMVLMNLLKNNESRLIEVLNSFLSFLKNKSINLEDKLFFSLKISENTYGDNTVKAFDSLINIYNNKFYNEENHKKIIENILKNQKKHSIFISIDFFSNILKSKAYDDEKYLESLLKITKKDKIYVPSTISTIHLLISDSKFNYDKFGHIFYFIINKIDEGSVWQSLELFLRIIKDPKWNHPLHTFCLFDDLVNKNLKEVEDFLKQIYYGKKRYKP